MLLIFSASCSDREMPSHLHPITTPTVPGYFPWPLLGLSNCINKLSGSIFSHHEHSSNWGLPCCLGLSLLCFCFLLHEGSETRHFAHFTVNYHNILLRIPKPSQGFHLLVSQSQVLGLRAYIPSSLHTPRFTELLAKLAN